jgi:ribosomal protein S18 acetylase RimI-like enzyme
MPETRVDLRIRRCDRADLAALRQIAWETYDETFRCMNSAQTMDAYLQEAFSPARLAAELANPASEFWFLFFGEELAGYLKVNDAPAQSDLNDPRSLEVERIYVRRAHKGKGLGRALMRHAESLARTRGRATLWLGVWEKNADAIAFYGKMGFRPLGRHTFRMGDELQSDLVMSRPVSDVPPAGDEAPPPSSPEGPSAPPEGHPAAPRGQGR